MQDGNVFIGETTKCDFFLTYFVSVYLLIKKKIFKSHWVHIL